jgi:putative transcriptional regulator
MKKIANNFFRIATRKVAPRPGSILVAEPFLDEDYFKHSVVTLFDYVKGDGAIGVVMNNRTDLLLDEVLDGVQSERYVPVYCGGPLGADRLYFLHTLGSELVSDAREFAPGLYVGGDFDAVIDYVNSGYMVDGAVRFFIGYSSWTAGQLENELRDDVWAIAENPTDAADMLRGEGDKYWHKTVRRLGDDFRAWRVIPDNYMAN